MVNQVPIIRLIGVDHMIGLIGLASLIGLAISHHNLNPCYDENGNAVRCIPPSVNAAYRRPIEATNTCGTTGPQPYCDSFGWKCQVCDAKDPRKSHPPSHMTDSPFRRSRWQSETLMQRTVQYPNSVNITLSLGNSYEITSIEIDFASNYPESFAIYKKTTKDSEWVPYQFYSSSCQRIYGLSNSQFATGNEVKALCSEKYSDLSPLGEGRVTFDPLCGRPNICDIEKDQILQDWVTVSDLKIVLKRINTFGDEAFSGPHVRRSYYYAISNIRVEGRCKCNGHASECVDGQNNQLRCKCQHHTQGQNCEMCEEFYYSRPWHPAVHDNAHECKACDCHCHSNICFFDGKLYNKTGDGGRCIECCDFTTGAHCERCKDFHYRDSEDGPCVPCDCHPSGSESQQCDSSGKCLCRPGVWGTKCNCQ